MAHPPECDGPVYGCLYCGRQDMLIEEFTEHRESCSADDPDKPWFNVQISTANAAFADDPGAELAVHLRRLAYEVEQYGVPSEEIPLRDANGQSCGKAWLGPNPRIIRR